MKKFLLEQLLFRVKCSLQVKDKMLKVLLGESEFQVEVIQDSKTRIFIMFSDQQIKKYPFLPQLILFDKREEVLYSSLLEYQNILSGAEFLYFDNVSEFFRKVVLEDIMDFYENMPENLIPRDRSFYENCVILDGDLGGVKARSFDPYTGKLQFDWFDLHEVPIGGGIYHFSPLGSLYLFIRDTEDFWDAIMIPKVEWIVTRDNENFGTLLKGAMIAYDILS